MKLSFGNSQPLKCASHFRKKNPLRYFPSVQVRKADEDTDNKGTSQLIREVLSEIAKHPRRRSFKNS